MTKISLVLLASALAAGAATADQILERVAANQTRSVEARQRWTYNQSVFVRLSRSDGKLAREELREYTVMPVRSGLRREMVRFEGRYQDKGRTVGYTQPGFARKDLDIDAEIAGELPDDLLGNANSRDGLDPDLFPLTADRQKRYVFQLHGQEDYRGKAVWRLTFAPRPEQNAIWAGEALIDAAEYQPVLVTTHMARKLPLAVRTVLGTDLEHLGFKVEYERLGEGVWFPSKYSGEFNLKAVFFYKRRIAISMRNSGFQKTDVRSTIDYLLAGSNTLSLP